MSPNTDTRYTERETFPEDWLFFPSLFWECNQEERDSAANAIQSANTPMWLREKVVFPISFHFRGICEKFVKMHCAWTERNIQAAKSQLDIVLGLYPEWNGMQGVPRVKDMLGWCSFIGIYEEYDFGPSINTTLTL